VQIRAFAGDLWRRYMSPMLKNPATEPFVIEGLGNAGAARPLTFVVLRDHARLPSRFFGRLTASIQAAL